MVRNRTKNPLSCWINTFPYRNKSYIWHNTLYTHCLSDKHAMTVKKNQQQQQRRTNTPPPPPSPIESSPPSSFVEDPGESLSVNVTDAALYDRFIHEAGPPTAISILRTQPAFIGKLYKMLEDDTQNMICWSPSGDFFSVCNSSLFSKQVLPQYFKHNNWQSFVRQLNMYGFSKINEMIHSNLNFDNQTWDFKHPHFKRGDFQSLTLVKRKPVRSSPMSTTSIPHQPTTLPSTDNNNNNNNHNINANLSNTSGQSTFTQTPIDFDANEDTGIDNRIRYLDEKVRHVSTNVLHLTDEIHDIKSLIFKQQNIIHELVTLVRNCTESSSPVINESTSHRNHSLPSIHNLAGDLQRNSSTHQYPPPPPPSSLLHQLPPEPSPSPPLADQEQKRRSSHPSSSSKGKSKQTPNSIYPLKNTTPQSMPV